MVKWSNHCYRKCCAVAARHLLQVRASTACDILEGRITFTPLLPQTGTSPCTILYNPTLNKWSFYLVCSPFNQRNSMSHHKGFPSLPNMGRKHTLHSGRNAGSPLELCVNLSVAQGSLMYFFYHTSHSACKENITTMQQRMSGIFRISHQHGVLATIRVASSIIPPPTISLTFTGRPGNLPKVEPNICSPIKVDVFIVAS